MMGLRISVAEPQAVEIGQRPGQETRRQRRLDARGRKGGRVLDVGLRCICSAGRAQGFPCSVTLGSILMACCKVAEIGVRGRKMRGRTKRCWGLLLPHQNEPFFTSESDVGNGLDEFCKVSDSLSAESVSGIILQRPCELRCLKHRATQLARRLEDSRNLGFWTMAVVENSRGTTTHAGSLELRELQPRPSIPHIKCILASSEKIIKS